MCVRNNKGLPYFVEGGVHTRHLTFIDVRNHHGNHQDTTIMPWILRGTCNTACCECLTKVILDIIYIQGTAYEQNGPVIHTQDLTIQIIVFNFTRDRFLNQAIQKKEYKYKSLRDAMRATRLGNQTHHSYNCKNKESHIHKKHRTSWKPTFPKFTN